jgi:hypothetical protein
VKEKMDSNVLLATVGADERPTNTKLIFAQNEANMMGLMSQMNDH